MKNVTRIQASCRKPLRIRIWDARYLYLLLLPGILYFAIFHYGPMSGLVLAFKKFNARMGSPWVGMKNFQRIFATPAAMTAIRNTFEINLSRLIFQFPVAIILALLLNEMRGRKLKRVYQTVYTFPHFLSWITVSSILMNFLSNGGAVNAVIASLGMERIDFLSNTQLFRPLLYLTHNWKEMGWNSIIYMAAIAAIDPTLYEAAKVDGANRWQQVWHVTLPGIKQTIVVLFILEVGRTMNAGFEQVFSLYSPAVYEVADVFETYSYRVGFLEGRYSYSSAVGLFQSVVGLIMILVTNKIAGAMGETGLW